MFVLFCLSLGLMDRIFLYVVGIMIGVWRGMLLFQDKFHDEGFDCGIIVVKMDILTDNGTGEYKRLSDKYKYMGCKIVDKKYIQDM